jgi:hypothetical protein
VTQNEESTYKVKQLVEKLLEKTTHPIEGKMGIDYEIFREVVSGDPETAAELVYVLTKQPAVPSTLGQIAMTIAKVYRVEFDDDSLEQAISLAQWSSKIERPRELTRYEQEELDPLDRLVEADPETTRLFDVRPEDLEHGSIDNLVRALLVEGASADRANKMASLWGRCVITFSLDNDPRHITLIPEARAYIAKLHETMPYFPCYLDFRAEWGMFIVYFGCLAQSEAMVNDLTAINVMHPSVLDKLEGSLAAIKSLAERLGKNPRPIWRAILSYYPDEVAEEYLNQLVAG